MATAYLNSSRINAKLLLGLIGGSSLGYYYLNVNQPTPTLFNNNHGSNNNQSTNKWVKYSPALVFPVSKIPEGKTQKDFQEVYNAIADKVREEDDADEGAGRYGLLTRLAWHSSGTFDKAVGSGGSFGGTMVHAPESSDPANAGLQIGVEFLKEFLDKYPWISRGDLWTLGGVVAVQEAGGPTIKWRPGRENCEDLKKVPKNGYLPDASKDGAYVKNLFARMGFNERETVALIGAHALGRCHTDRSGYDGPWGPSPNMFTNDFFVRLLDGWHVKKWDGPKQYEDDEFKSFMMLPTDMALKEESYFLKYVKMYAADQDLFFKDFSAAFTKLLENGIDFQNQPYMTFKTLDDQDL